MSDIQSRTHWKYEIRKFQRKHYSKLKQQRIQNQTKTKIGH